MIKYGLSEEQLTTIRHVLANEPAVDEAVWFGSRAYGTYKKTSDIDLAIKGEFFDRWMANALKSKLEEETNIPYFFDIIAFQSVQSTELMQQINEQGAVIYRKR